MRNTQYVNPVSKNQTTNRTLCTGICSFSETDFPAQACLDRKQNINRSKRIQYRKQIRNRVRPQADQILIMDFRRGQLHFDRVIVGHIDRKQTVVQIQKVLQRSLYKFVKFVKRIHCIAGSKFNRHITAHIQSCYDIIFSIDLL